jgi:hypothetical protein
MEALWSPSLSNRKPTQLTTGKDSGHFGLLAATGTLYQIEYHELQCYTSYDSHPSEDARLMWWPFESCMLSQLPYLSPCFNPMKLSQSRAQCQFLPSTLLIPPSLYPRASSPYLLPPNPDR